jgi:hypothetical protein
MSGDPNRLDPTMQPASVDRVAGALIREIYSVPSTAGRRSRLAREWRQLHAALAADRRYICRRTS